MTLVQELLIYSSLFSFIYFVIVVRMWINNRSMTILLTSILAYYWTYYGAIPILETKNRNENLIYHYLEAKIFPINDYSIYAYTLVLYSIFLILLLFLFGNLSRNHKFSFKLSNDWQKIAIYFPHSFLLAPLLILSIATYQSLSFLQSTVGSYSIYSAHWSIGRVLNYSLAILGVSSMFGLMISLLNPKKGRQLSLSICYFLLVFFWIFSMGLAGRRNLSISLVLVLILFIYNERSKLNFGIKSLLGASFFLILAFYFTLVIGITRGTGAGQNFVEQLKFFIRNFSNFDETFLVTQRSGEHVAAHFSLYAVLKQNLEINPLALDTTYNIYKNLIDAPSGQGYTIHPLTSMYLLVGPVSVILSPLLLMICMMMVRKMTKINSMTRFGFYNLVGIYMATVIFPTSLFRGGVESIWGLFLTLVVFPAFLLYFPYSKALNRMRQMERIDKNEL